MHDTGALAERQAELRAAVGGRGRGRPRLALNPVEVFELAMLGLSNRQIASRLQCDHKTLRSRFAANLERARVRRRALLQVREMQLVEDSWTALKAQLKASIAAGGKKRD